MQTNTIYNPYICSFIALSGVWYILYPEQCDDANFIFIKKDWELGSAAEHFDNHLHSTDMLHSDIVSKWGVPARIGSHSARKGSAMCNTPYCWYIKSTSTTLCST